MKPGRAGQDAGEAATPPPLAEIEARVVAVVRDLARETGGPRAARAVTARASLEREVGLGSLERVELLSRLEQTFDRTLPDECLAADDAASLAVAVARGQVQVRRERQAEHQDDATAAVEIGPVQTLHESLWRHAQRDGTRIHVHLRSEDAEEETVSYRRLLQEAAAVAGGLAERGVVRGDRVALMLPTGIDFLRSFLGVLLVRAVAVPIYPPLRMDRLEEYAQRQARILADAGAKLLVTVARARPIARLLQPTLPALAAVTTADELAGSGRLWPEPDGESGDPALIQYTSGSTGRPKGVLLSHANLLANIEAIASGLALRPTDVGVSWLPLYHDMGLIGCWLTCLHRGLPLTLLPPTAFLARPERWLWAIHQRAATLSAAPNFAYELCARRPNPAAIEGLDLSSWRVALNGAEPVSPGTLQRFTARFAPHGFAPKAMLPVYGLAECSVALAFPPLGREPRIDRVARAAFQQESRAEAAEPNERGALEFVSAGSALPGHELRIVDEAGREQPERRVGRLVFRGPSAMAGYYGQPDATAQIRIGEGFLDSGDLAYLAEGELFVCGRRKDLVIKGGRNLVPQEIEEAAAGVAGIRRGCVAAFGVPDAAVGTESLVVMAETRVTGVAERERLSAAVVEAVAATVDVPPDLVVLVPPGTVPKTSSGKVRRSAARDLHLAGQAAGGAHSSAAWRLRLAIALLCDGLVSLPARLARATYAVWLVVAVPPLVLGAWFLVTAVPARRFAARVIQRGCDWLLRVAGCPVSASGLERLPAEGAAVLVSNHASYVDVALLLAVLPPGVRVVAKREVLGTPFLRTFVRRGGHLPVDRRDALQGLADTAAIERALRDGARVLFFPEGTFTAATGLRPFRLGAFKAAAAARAPVIPIGLRGTRSVMRGEWTLPRPGRLRVEIGQALSPAREDLGGVVELRERTAAAIAAACGEDRIEQVAAGPLPARQRGEPS